MDNFEKDKIKNISKIRNVSDFASIQISLASPERIREISYGQVKKPETINYRSLRPERDGLFCEKIFGTTKEWECYCGKFKSFRYKGVVCDRCGVEVEHFKVRRERIGHIELAAPVAHIWYYKSVPSRIGLLLGITISDLKSIIYYEKYVVIESNDTELKEKQLLTEREYLEYKKQYGVNFTAETGALAIKLLLQRIDLKKEEEEFRMHMHEKGNRTDTRLLKRLEIIKDFQTSNNRPEWMILDVLPVIPPELRPMVQLDTGRFATSDSNDLYRRLLNRNNRCFRLQHLNAPDIILRNEKRMLQEAVDALFDNSKRKRIIKGPGNRPLKSIADMLKGKQGRFRQNLLGKRVDYSGRTVIVVGPKLQLHQCGLPKKMALELFKPFVMRDLVKKEIVYNIKSAKNLIDRESPEIWGVLEEVIRGYPILLNRAPTLHRLGIQAFEPILIDGKAIQLHPLVCHAFNADFDGDQMAVHVPLSPEAQIESWVLMLSSNNILNPANGESIVTPTQDIILGIFLLTSEKKADINQKIKNFSSFEEVELAIDLKVMAIQDSINVYCQKSKQFIKTTAGRVIFNNVFNGEMDFINEVIIDKTLGKIILKIFKTLGHHKTVIIIDKIKNLGFEYATHFGMSIGLSDIKIPKQKHELIEEGNTKVNKIEENYQNGYITNDEKINQIIDVWTRINDLISDKMMEELKQDQEGFNPLYVMAESGARGSKQQIRQLAGMRGLMAKPSGEIIELPIKSNFKEGLNVLEYFISTHGARKGLADTAIKTADAGYLTRRLVDIAQDMVIRQYDCNTINGVERNLLINFDGDKDTIIHKIEGRFILEDVYDPMSGKKLIGFKEEITEDIANAMFEMNIEKIRIRSVITCEAQYGICAFCYGRNLANGRLVEIGEAVGVIAAQSIGQPGTQLTMRTFHIGGTAASDLEDKNIIFNYPIYIKSLPDGLIESEDKEFYILTRKGDLFYNKVLSKYNLADFSEIEQKKGSFVMLNENIGKDLNGNSIFANNTGIIKIEEKQNLLLICNKIDTCYPLKNGTKLYIWGHNYIEKDTLIGEFDLYNEPIFARENGSIKFIDIIAGSTLKIEESKSQDVKIQEKIITEIRDGSLTPRIAITNDLGEILITISIPSGAYLLVSEGDHVKPSDVIAKITRAQTKTKDITGGLPRISELFEARKPKDVAILAEKDGIIHFGEKTKGKFSIYVEYETFDDLTHEPTTKKFKHVIPMGKRILVTDGDYVRAGDLITDGSMSPHDILRIQGVEKLQEYLTSEILSVYSLQGVQINDKHIGIIIRQMLRKLEIHEPGDTDFIVGQQVDKFQFQAKNKQIISEGGKAASAIPILQGITKASLNIDSFISAASFQETTKILTNAAIRGSIDYLQGLKENVIIGHLIPAGSGVKNLKKKLISNMGNLEGELLHKP